MNRTTTTNKIEYIEKLLGELKEQLAEELNTNKSDNLNDLVEDVPMRMTKGMAEDYNMVNGNDLPPRSDEIPFKAFTKPIVVLGIMAVLIVIICLIV